MNQKQCRTCREIKPWSAFNIRASGYPQPYCKLCKSISNRERYASDPEKYRTQIRLYQTENREKIKERVARKKYNLTAEEYYNLPKECAICNTDEDLCIDHDHVTGKVRGVLCGKHNRALGLFEDDVSLLLRAVDYLLGITLSSIKDKLVP